MLTTCFPHSPPRSPTKPMNFYVLFHGFNILFFPLPAPAGHNTTSSPDRDTVCEAGNWVITSAVYNDTVQCSNCSRRGQTGSSRSTSHGDCTFRDNAWFPVVNTAHLLQIYDNCSTPANGLAPCEKVSEDVIVDFECLEG